MGKNNPLKPQNENDHEAMRSIAVAVATQQNQIKLLWDAIEHLRKVSLDLLGVIEKLEARK